MTNMRYGEMKNHSKVIHIFLTVFILLYLLYNLHQDFIYIIHYTIMNQVMKCNGTSYHGNAGDDTENLMKNASIRFPFSFYYNNKPENQDVDAQRMT